MEPVWGRGIWWNLRDQKDMVCIIIYVSLAISRHWSTSACDGHRCITSLPCENHARKMRTFFTRRLEPKTRWSYHIKWPWLRTPSASDYPWNARGIFTVQFITIEVGPGLGFFFSSFPPSSPLLPPLWPPRPLEFKVIQIQSDHLLAASPPVAAMERSKVTCSIQVCWRKLGPHQEGLLWPSHEVHWTPCWLGSYFSSSSLMLLSYTNNLLALAIDKLPWCLKRV